MSKPCANCSAEIPEGAPFCDNCGMPVSETAPPVPPRKAQPSPTLPEESAPDRGSQLEQGEQLPASPATLPETSAPDPYIGEQRRGVPGWVIAAAGIVGTAARRVPRWAVGVAAGLVAMAVSQRQGADAVEENPTADSATQQNTEMAEAVVPDPASIDQGEANADQAGEIAPAAAVTEPPGPTLDPDLLDPTAPAPTIDTGLVDQVEPSPDLVNMVNQNPDLAAEIATTGAPTPGEAPAADPGASETDPTLLIERNVDLFDPAAEGATLDPALFDPNTPGASLDPALFDPNSPGPTLDPALFDPNSPGPTLDPALFDPAEPGPTVDPSLLDEAASGPTIDPNLLDPNAPGPTLDLSTILQGLMEPSSITDLDSVTALSPTEPGIPESDPQDQDLDDMPNL